MRCLGPITLRKLASGALRPRQNPNARFAVLYQNERRRKDYLRGVKEALGADADKAIAMAASFEVADPTVDSQILTLANTKADVFLIYSVTRGACAQAIRKAYETGWHPMRFISSGCANKETVMCRPARKPQPASCRSGR